MNYSIPMTPGGREAEVKRLLGLAIQTAEIREALNPDHDLLNDPLWDVEIEILTIIDAIDDGTAT